MKIALMHQAGNFIGPEYYHALKDFDVTPITMGVMSNESRGRELDRTGGLWKPEPIPCVLDFTDFEDRAVRELSRYDYAVNGGVGGKLTPDILVAPKNGWINVHPGKLPAFRGSSCPEWAVLVGEDVYATAHIMNQGLDTGPIILSERYDINPDWSYREFRANLYKHCASVLVKALKSVNTRGVLPQVGFGVTWPPMPPQILDRVKRRFSPYLPGVLA